MPTPVMTSRGKLERSLRRLRELDRLLNSPKVSEKAKTRLRSAKSLQQTAIKLRRKALIRIRWSGEPHQSKVSRASYNSGEDKWKGLVRSFGA